MASAAAPNKNDLEEKDSALEMKKLKQELRAKQEEVGQLRGNLTKVMKKNDRLVAQLAEKAPSSVPKEVPAATPPNTTVTAVAPTTVIGATPVMAESSAPKAPSNTEGEVHLAKWEPPYCPDCGGKNESFKDQVKCKNCNAPLGSEEYAKHTMKVCPLCGSGIGYVPVSGYNPVHSGCSGPDCKLVQVKA